MYDATVRTQPLGPGGPAVTAVGLGDVRLALAAARGIDAREVDSALRAGIEAGITIIEVSEEADARALVGAAMRELRARDSVVVATPLISQSPGLPPDLVALVQAALRATRLDALPLALLPLRAAWASERGWPDFVASCARLVRGGDVMRWGWLLDAYEIAPPPPSLDALAAAAIARPSGSGLIVSLSDFVGAPAPSADPVDAYASILGEGWLSAIALPWNLCDRSCEPLRAAARAANLAVLARRPLAGGALAGALGPGVHLAPRDDRADADLDRFAVAAAKLAALTTYDPPAAGSAPAARAALAQGKSPLAERTTIGSLALRFAIDTAGIALPRLHRAAHLPEALAAAAAPPLAADLAAALDAISRDI